MACVEYFQRYDSWSWSMRGHQSGRGSTAEIVPPIMLMYSCVIFANCPAEYSNLVFVELFCVVVLILYYIILLNYRCIEREFYQWQ